MGIIVGTREGIESELSRTGGTKSDIEQVLTFGTLTTSGIDQWAGITPPPRSVKTINLRAPENPGTDWEWTKDGHGWWTEDLVALKMA